MGAPTELWFGSNEENGDSDPWSAYEREARYRDYDDLGPWRLERYSVREPIEHLPSAELIVEWFTEREPEAGDLSIDVDYLAESVSVWAAENGEVDEWWCEQADDAFDHLLAEALITEPTEANAEALRAAIASGIRYRMAGDHLGTHELTRTFGGKVYLDGEYLGAWDAPPPVCCRACNGKGGRDARGLPLPPVTCGECGAADCPHADAHVNRCGATR